MINTIAIFRWMFFFAGILALASSISHANTLGIILYIIAIILATPGISRLFRPRKPNRAAILCFVAAFIIMGIAQGVISQHNSSEQVNVVLPSQLSEQGYISGNDILVGEPPLGSIAGQPDVNPPTLDPDQDILSNPFEAGEMIIHFIDVGQGDATLVESDGHYMLVDMGPIDAADQLLQYLEKNNITHLDTLVITHPHADHVNVTAVSGLTSRLQIDTIKMPDTTTSTGYALLDYALDVIEEAGIDVELVSAGEEWRLGSVQVRAVAPNSSYYEELNNYSLVLHLQTANTSALLCADAEELSEQEMILHQSPLRSDIIRVGHHGSTTSSSKIFMAFVRPQYAVISCGTGNEYGHPHAETMTLLRLLVGAGNIYRTDTQGTIIAHCAADGSISWTTNN